MIVALLLATLTATNRTGDAILVHGEHTFGRNVRMSFFVGDEYAPWQYVDWHTARVLVPSVAAGERWLSYVNDITTDTTGAIRIARLHIVEEKETTLPAGDLLRVKATDAVKVHRLRSNDERFIIRSQLMQERQLPPISFGEAFVITAERVTEIIDLRLHVPDDWLRRVPQGFEPEVYYYYEDHGANDEVIPGVQPLHAEWDASKRQLHAVVARTLTVARDSPLTLYLAVRSKS